MDTITTVRDTTMSLDISNIKEINEFDKTKWNINDSVDVDHKIATSGDDSDYIPESEQEKTENAKSDTKSEFKSSSRITKSIKIESVSKEDKSDTTTGSLVPDATGQYQCMMCQYKCYKKTLMSRHLTTHFDNKPHQCADCDMSFKTSGCLTRHIKYCHIVIKPHKCSECDYSCVEFTKLQRHMRVHTGERPYKCPLCTYASSDRFKQKRHMRTHTGEKPYECNICNFSFTQWNSLKSHQLLHSVKESQDFQCNLCPTTCKLQTDLRLHIQDQHNTDHPVTCERCSEVLPDRYSHKMHIKKHEGEKCYDCKLCPYVSLSQSHLSTHMLIHTVTKPFISVNKPVPREKVHMCPQCKRSFALIGNLTRHMKTHDQNSQLNEEKLKCKRMKQDQPDGTIVTKVKTPFIYPNEDAMNEEIKDEELVIKEEKEDYVEEHEENISCVHKEYVAKKEDEQITVDKPDITREQEKMPSMSPSKNKSILELTAPYKTVSIKKEHDGTEFMEVQVNEDHIYKVMKFIPAE